MGSPTVALAGDAPVNGGYLTYSSTTGGGPYNYVSLGQCADMQFGSATDFSIAFWIRQTPASVQNPDLPFICDTTGSLNGGPHQGWCIAPSLSGGLSGTGNGGWGWSLLDSTANQTYNGGAGNTINDGNWHHVVFVFARASSEATYLDGKVYDTHPILTIHNIDNVSSPINIGQDASGAYDVTAGANMADFGVWRRALTQLEISGMYLGGTSNQVSFALAAPKTYYVSGVNACGDGSSSVTVTLTNSDSGVNYQLYLNGTTKEGSPVAGTGSAISFPAQTAAGNYTVVATDTNSLYTANMGGTVTVYALPTAYSVTGGGCPGDSGAIIGLSNSQTGKSYELWLDTGFGPSDTGLAVSGTGSTISFSPQSTPGSYTVVATDGTTHCTANMTGSVTVNASPNSYNVTGGGAFCAGGAGELVGLDGSDTGVTYQLKRGATAVGSPVSGTGSAISFGLQTLSGNYTVVATLTASACTLSMNSSATVTANPVPAVFTVTGGGIAGSGGAPVGLSGSQSGVSYQLYSGVTAVGSSVAGTGGAIAFPNQSASGTYTVVATATGGCTAAMLGSAVVTAMTPVTISKGFDGTTISYSGGSGAQFVLLTSSNPGAALSTWTRVQTNTVSPGTFTVAPAGSTFYSIKSE
jgi:hypothetical protein